jgi:hypothetical protein
MWQTWAKFLSKIQITFSMEAQCKSHLSIAESLRCRKNWENNLNQLLITSRRKLRRWRRTGVTHASAQKPILMRSMMLRLVWAIDGEVQAPKSKTHLDHNQTSWLTWRNRTPSCKIRWSSWNSRLKSISKYNLQSCPKGNRAARKIHHSWKTWTLVAIA